MSEQSGEKTFAPSERRLREAAKNGDVIRSRELATAAAVAVGAVWLMVAGPWLLRLLDPLLDALETELEAVESQIFERGAGRPNVQRLYELKRRALLLRHAVAPLLEMVDKLHGGRVPAVCQGTQEYFRDVHDHLARINAAIDTIRDTIATAIQVNLSMVTIEESETTKRLAAWAAIFAVCTAMVGVWGMNFEHMPELKWHFGYPLALGLVATAAFLLHRRFRRAGWL